MKRKESKQAIEINKRRILGISILDVRIYPESQVKSIWAVRKHALAAIHRGHHYGWIRKQGQNRI